MDSGCLYRKEGQTESMWDKIMIACYSDTGSTLRVAKAIQRKTGGTLCIIYPWQPYPPGTKELKAQAKREIREGFHPRLLPIPVKTENYPVLFIGTPCWEGRISPPVASFLEQVNTDGKIVIPFSICGEEGPGYVERDIAGLCPRAKIIPGFHVTDAKIDCLSDRLDRWILEIMGNGILNSREEL